MAPYPSVQYLLAWLRQRVAGSSHAAADLHLSDDSKENQKGIGVQDDFVFNDYHTFEDRKPKPHHHKSYGYRRTPEMAEYLKDFLIG